MNEPVYILGGGRTDFKRNLKKEGKTIRHLIIEAGKNAIDDAKIDRAEIQAGLFIAAVSAAVTTTQEPSIVFARG